MGTLLIRAQLAAYQHLQICLSRAALLLVTSHPPILLGSSFFQSEGLVHVEFHKQREQNFVLYLDYLLIFKFMVFCGAVLEKLFG